MKLFLVAASLRRDSLNKKLIRVAEGMLKELGHEVDRGDFAEFDLPLYHADLETSDKPAGVKKWVERMNRAEGVVLSSPEYNFSMPGVLKNLIDWVSRVKPMPWKGQQILLLSASPSLVGGNRGLWHLRVPLEACGAFVYPEMFSLAQAHEAFDAAGHLKDAKIGERLKSTLQGFIHHNHGD